MAVEKDNNKLSGMFHSILNSANNFINNNPDVQEYNKLKANQSHASNNATLTDDQLRRRAAGEERGTSIIDQTTAGYALANREKAEGMK